MKPSARAASIFIILFFLFFNGLQVYLVIERLSDAKTKFSFACSDALISTLFEYNKLKSVDSSSLPEYALVAYARQKIEITRPDTQHVSLSAASTPLLTDTVDAAFIETVLNTPGFRSIDLRLFDRLFKKSLRSKSIRSEYRLDTIRMQASKSKRPPIQVIWAKKKRKEYYYATRPARLPYNSDISVFAQVKYDRAYFQQDLLWPLLAFAAILLIGNTALVFVYRTIKKQKRINELKTDFINNITHEMKTPITIASAGLQALELHVTPTERTSFYLHTSKRQLLLLNEFVERILEAAVQDVSDFTLRKEKIDLHALLEELVQSYSVLQGKPVDFRLKADGPAFIMGDRLHLETAFHNIIDNAIKYSNGPVLIHIDLVESNRDCTIKISDNGMGIPPQFVKSIFDKFFRVPQGDAQSIKGFGLGLYYVRNIVKKHSGNIEVHSKWQSGTEFIITLPKTNDTAPVDRRPD
ncbi:MAG: HAMP domain-containing histidine kinase [Chitinophagaceae bacterium]|nr:MAG: HAMP domain-containing histidine kinase [Chitinophagaceae bacterium]